MPTILLNLIWINVICAVVIDISDFPQSFKRALSWMLTRGRMCRDDFRLHLVDCSFCVTFWASLIYIMIAGVLSPGWLAACLVSACLTSETRELIFFTKDFLNAIARFASKLIKKI